MTTLTILGDGALHVTIFRGTAMKLTICGILLVLLGLVFCSQQNNSLVSNELDLRGGDDCGYGLIVLNHCDQTPPAPQPGKSLESCPGYANFGMDINVAGNYLALNGSNCLTPCNVPCGLKTDSILTCTGWTYGPWLPK